MRFRFHILKEKEAVRQCQWALSLMAVIFSLAACSEAEEPVPSDDSDGRTYLNIRLQTQEAASSLLKPTKASTSDSLHRATTGENALHTVRVWAFDSHDTSSNAKPLGFKIQLLSGVTPGSYTFFMPLEPGSADKLDLYVLVNAESANTLLGDGSHLTRGEVENAVISDRFGIESGVPQCKSVPQYGLPMSRVVTGVSWQSYKSESPLGSAQTLNIPLCRCVSKLNFFWARANVDETEEATITRVVVDGNIIPSQQNVFPAAIPYDDTLGDNYPTGVSLPSGVTYDSNTFDCGSVANTSITKVVNPLLYRKDANGSETMQQYLDRLEKAGFASDYQVYLRESDQVLSGTIYYKKNASATESSASFSFSKGDLVRNHECVIYAYIIGGVVTALQYHVIPWEGNSNNNIEFN